MVAGVALSLAVVSRGNLQVVNALPMVAAIAVTSQDSKNLARVTANVSATMVASVVMNLAARSRIDMPFAYVEPI